MKKSRLPGAIRLLLPALGSILFVAANAFAQAYWTPQPAPLASAESETWFRLGQPIAFEGYVYYPAGPRVYFDNNTMVRSGAFRGIPIYTDTTIEPYSRIFVPVSGMLQPYERRRTGDAAGTTGSRAPSFPVDISGEPSEEPSLVGAEEPRGGTGTASRAAPMLGTTGPLPLADVVEAGLRPKGLNEIYVTFLGSRWKAAGKAVPLAAGGFEEIGKLHGFPVYTTSTETRNPRVIYVPSRAGLIAPYEKAGAALKY